MVGDIALQLARGYRERYQFGVFLIVRQEYLMEGVGAYIEAPKS
jgi:hypothetical protein